MLEPNTAATMIPPFGIANLGDQATAAATQGLDLPAGNDNEADEPVEERPPAEDADDQQPVVADASAAPPPEPGHAAWARCVDSAREKARV